MKTLNCLVTTLIFVTLSTSVTSLNTVLEPDFALSYGDWYEMEKCPKGSFSYAFNIKIVPDAYDDMGMTGIRLYCKTPEEDTISGHIESFAMDEGEWLGIQNCSNGWLNGFRMKSQREQGNFRDDTAANDVDMTCTEGRSLKGSGTEWGIWSGYSVCPIGDVICGIQTLVETGRLVDDTGLNNIKMLCCQLPRKKIEKIIPTMPPRSDIPPLIDVSQHTSAPEITVIQSSQSTQLSHTSEDNKCKCSQDNFASTSVISEIVDIFAEDDLSKDIFSGFMGVYIASELLEYLR